MKELGESVETLVIGGGQSGLAVGYQLTQRGLPFLIVDANERVGDAWRNRWDSLRLFTPNFFNRLPGLPFPGPRWELPTKDEFADYLEGYAQRFKLPVRTGVEVDVLSRNGDRFVATAGDRRFEADNVVVAMSSWQRPRVPEFAAELDPGILQLKVAEYRNPGQLQEGDALVVGAGNSGAEIAIDLAKTHRVWLSGPDTGQLPFRPDSAVARVLMPFIGRVIFHRVLTTSTPIGRRARSKMLAKGDLLIRVKSRDLAAAGVERVPRTTGVENGYLNLRTAGASTSPTWSGAAGRTPDFLGSTCPCSARRSRTTTGESWHPSPASTSSVSSSCTRSRPSRSTG